MPVGILRSEKEKHRLTKIEIESQKNSLGKEIADLQSEIIALRNSLGLKNKECLDLKSARDFEVSLPHVETLYLIESKKKKASKSKKK